MKLRLRRSFLSIAVSVALLQGCQSISPVKQQQPDLLSSLPQLAYEKFTLPNGLTVIVHEDRKAPVVAVNLWYKVGSKDEKPGKTGFAHLFEHLMFQGSEHFKGEFFEPFEKAGATAQNGTTNADRTNYFETVPTNALDMALWMESDRMGHFLGSISQAKLDEQRGVVKNEKRQGDNSPYGKMWDLLFTASYPEGHPYSWDTIGSMDDLNAASLDDVKKWFKRYYGPSNAVLVLAGDIDVATAKAKVSKYFGDIPAGPPLAKPEQWVAKLTDTKRYTIQDRVPQARVAMVWNIPAKETAAERELDLVAALLGGGKQSPLYQRLVQKDQLASSVAAFSYARLLGGQFVIIADAKPGVDTQQIEAVIQEELDKIKQQLPSRQDLQRVINSQVAGFIESAERVGGFGGVSDILAENEFYSQNPTTYYDRVHYQATVEPEALQQAAQQWLDKGKLVITVTPFPEYTHAKVGADRSKLPKVGDIKPVQLPEFKTFTLSNGIQVSLAQRTGTPTLSMAWLFDAGLAAEQGLPSGIADLTLSMMREGTQQRSVIELENELDELGASFYSYTDIDTSVFQLTAIRDQFEPSLAIAVDVLQNPAFNQEDFKRKQSNWLDRIAQEKAEPHSMAMRILPELLYGKQHPYSTPWTASGREDDIKRVTPAQLKQFHQAWIRPDNSQLVVVGDISEVQLKATLERQFAKWQKPEQVLPQKQIPQVQPTKQRKLYLIDKPDADQSVIYVGQLLSIHDKSEIPLRIMNDIFGGQFSARLNTNLREDKHWSYGAYSYLQEAEGQSPLMMVTSVQTDKTIPALQEIQKEVKGYLGKKPASQSELDKIKQNWLRSRAGELQTNDAVLSLMVGQIQKDKPLDELHQFDQQVQRVPLKTVRQVTQQFLHPQEMIWVVVGDLKKMKGQWQKLGFDQVETLDPKKSL
ncbi:insulinase family protein [Zooshikella marina]|uniref:M16 family metallopeptidase n=1 Tax=Zooshikella ganghwensis TaxID=202772 RepID=UPI001BB03836|nr:pitrilysin family protein [Zooshikella ganghwensis]MBU2705310.1 insulinase family protein [Zooshikella ganghwensis]